MLTLCYRYMANPRAETREDLLSTIHRALVEVTTLQLAGLPLEIARNATSPTNVDRHRIAKGARFEATTNGRTFLVLEHEELRQAILDYLQPKKIPIQEDAVEEEDQLDTTPLEEAPEEEWMQATRVDDTMETEGLDTTSHEVEVSEDALEEQFQDEVLDDPSAYSPVDESWSQTSLADPELKFAVGSDLPLPLLHILILSQLLKRVMQLTGRRVPDPDINIIRDCKSLLAYLVKKPKPKKLVEALFANEAVDLPNVEIRERRYTPIDREKEIGRWKVIEQELEKRGLPVTGKGFVALGDPIA